MDLGQSAMPSILRCVVLFGALAVAPAAIAEEAVQLEPSSDAKEAAYTKKVVCKKQAVVGTKISKNVCRTRAEVDGQRANSQEFLDTIQKTGAIQTTSKQ